MTTANGERYRRKPSEVTAVQVWEVVEIPDHPNGHMIARPGDWIVTGQGCRWVCESDVFPLLYEKVQP